MSGTIWIDPGYAKSGKGCACSLFRPNLIGVPRLMGAWFMRSRDWREGLPDVVKVTYELPQQDGRSRGVPPEVLIRLTAAGAELAGLYAGFARAQLCSATPSAWKGSVQKPIQHADIWDKLDAGERQVLGGDETWRIIDKACSKGGKQNWKKPGADYYPSTWLTHNLLDAVAMGVLGSGR